MKTCRTCLVEKNETEFYSTGKGGLKLDCRPCYRKRCDERPGTAASRAKYARSEKNKAAQRKWRQSESGRLFNEAYRKTEIYAAHHRRMIANDRVRHPERYKARSAVSTAIMRGKLVPRPCPCGEPKAQAHHHNGYDRPHWLDVVWLCKRCHDDAHRKEKTG